VFAAFSLDDFLLTLSTVMSSDFGLATIVAENLDEIPASTQDLRFQFVLMCLIVCAG
jgi:hypothetical protein